MRNFWLLRQRRRKNQPRFLGSLAGRDPLSLPGVLTGRYRSEPEGVFARRNHGKLNRGAARIGVALLGFEPRAQSGIVDYWLPLPEIRTQRALNLQVIELQLDGKYIFWKIALRVIGADIEPGDT